MKIVVCSHVDMKEKATGYVSACLFLVYPLFVECVLVCIVYIIHTVMVSRIVFCFMKQIRYAFNVKSRQIIVGRHT